MTDYMQLWECCPCCGQRLIYQYNDCYHMTGVVVICTDCDFMLSAPTDLTAVNRIMELHSTLII